MLRLPPLHPFLPVRLLLLSPLRLLSPRLLVVLVLPWQLSTKILLLLMLLVMLPSVPLLRPVVVLSRYLSANILLLLSLVLSQLMLLLSPRHRPASRHQLLLLVRPYLSAIGLLTNRLLRLTMLRLP